MRLAALSMEPDCFGASLTAERTLSSQRWREELSQNCWYLARAGHLVVGMAALYLHDRLPDGAPQVGSMWVTPAWRRRGVAGSLLTECASAARRAGADSLGLWVTPNNERAKQVYYERGFRPTGARKPAPRDAAEQMQRMRRRLPLAGLDARNDGAAQSRLEAFPQRSR